MRSTDDGRTWRGWVDVADNHDMPGRALGSLNPAVFSDGDLFIPFLDFDRDLKRGTSAQARERMRYHYWFATSSDGGATFSRPQKFVLDGGGEIVGPFDIVPFFAIDNSDGRFRDRVYMVWADRQYEPLAASHAHADGFPESHAARLLISYSSDKGASWSQPKVVSAGTAGVGDQFLPAIAVNRDGAVAVSWYDTRDTPPRRTGVLVNRYFAASLDGGDTFLPAVKISSAPSDPGMCLRRVIGASASDQTIGFNNAGDRVSGGDYLGLAADTQGDFHPFWTDGRTGSYQIWTARVRVKRTDSTEQPSRTLVQADVSQSIDVVLDPLRESPSEGTVALPIRIKNKSDKPLYGPISVAIAATGTKMDYSRALGDFDVLPPGAISEAVVWRFKVPFSSRTVPRFDLKVTARVEAP